MFSFSRSISILNYSSERGGGDTLGDDKIETSIFFSVRCPTWWQKSSFQMIPRGRMPTSLSSPPSHKKGHHGLEPVEYSSCNGRTKTHFRYTNVQKHKSIIDRRTDRDRGHNRPSAASRGDDDLTGECVGTPIHICMYKYIFLSVGEVVQIDRTYLDRVLW